MQNPIQFGPFTIQNPNTSGQGVCDITQIKKHPLVNILLGNGFNYSHSVVIGAGAGHLPKICHCFNYPSYHISIGKERYISVFNDMDGKEIARFDSGVLGGVSKVYVSNHILALQIKLESHLKYLDGRIRAGIRKIRDKN